MKAGVWRHYKGPKYLVMGVAEDENGNRFVVYSRLYEREGNPMRLRPEQEFLENVNVGGVLQPRFVAEP